jgi:hypothetical protein
LPQIEIMILSHSPLQTLSSVLLHGAPR